MIQALRRLLPFVFAIGVLTIPCFSQASRGAGLAVALDSIRTDNVKSDIFFIASDELGGRDTPSSGQRIAARFIRARLQRLGLSPGTPDGYLYKYTLVRRELNLAGTSAQVVRAGKSIDFSFGNEYAFHSGGIATATTAGNVVYCGDVDVAKLETLDLAGKWALCEDNGLRTSDRRGAVKKAGAVGILLGPGSKTSDEKMASRIKEYLSGAKRPGVQFPGNRAEERELFPYLIVSGPAMAQMLLLAGPADPANARPSVGTDLGVVFTDTRKEDGVDGMVEVENVCGFWPGADPVLSKEVIIISAHYDHVGTDAAGVVFNGADDNGSGTTGLLQLAEALAVNGPMRRSVLLMWVSGEEKGLYGSRAWCSAPSLPEGHRAVCNINIDMIGRNAPDMLLITPTKARKSDYNGLTRLAESLCAEEGFPTLGSADQYWTRSDQVNFASYMKIPVAFLFSDVHEDYHQSTDDPEKIDCDKIRRVTRLVLRMIDGLQADKLDL